MKIFGLFRRGNEAIDSMFDTPDEARSYENTLKPLYAVLSAEIFKDRVKPTPMFWLEWSLALYAATFYHNRTKAQCKQAVALFLQSVTEDTKWTPIHSETSVLSLPDFVFVVSNAEAIFEMYLRFSMCTSKSSILDVCKSMIDQYSEREGRKNARSMCRDAYMSFSPEFIPEQTVSVKIEAPAEKVRVRVPVGAARRNKQIAPATSISDEPPSMFNFDVQPAPSFQPPKPFEEVSPKPIEEVLTVQPGNILATVLPETKDMIESSECVVPVKQDTTELILKKPKAVRH